VCKGERGKKLEAVRKVVRNCKREKREENSVQRRERKEIGSSEKSRVYQ
jgi:hypothetical protein